MPIKLSPLATFIMSWFVCVPVGIETSGGKTAVSSAICSSIISVCCWEGDKILLISFVSSISKAAFKFSSAENLSS